MADETEEYQEDLAQQPEVTSFSSSGKGRVYTKDLLSMLLKMQEDQKKSIEQQQEINTKLLNAIQITSERETKTISSVPESNINSKPTTNNFDNLNTISNVNGNNFSNLYNKTNHSTRDTRRIEIPKFSGLLNEKFSLFLNRLENYVEHYNIIHPAKVLLDALDKSAGEWWKSNSFLQLETDKTDPN